MIPDSYTEILSQITDAVRAELLPALTERQAEVLFYRLATQLAMATPEQREAISTRRFESDAEIGAACVGRAQVGLQPGRLSRGAGRSVLRSIVPSRASAWVGRLDARNPAKSLLLRFPPAFSQELSELGVARLADHGLRGLRALARGANTDAAASRSLPWLPAEYTNLPKTLSLASNWLDHAKCRQIVTTHAPTLLDRCLLAAGCVRDDVNVAIVQHGAAYGQLRSHPREMAERRVANTFISWSRVEEPALSAALIHDSHGRAGIRGVEVNRDERSRFWFAVTEVENSPRDGLPDPSYLLDLQKTFWSALDSRVRGRFYVRPRSKKRAGRVNSAPLLSDVPDDLIDPDVGTMRKSLLREAALVVFDYPFTTLLAEVAAANIPFLLVGDYRKWMTDEARALSGGLRELGVVIDDPVVAASEVNRIADDPSGWWGERGNSAQLSAWKNRFAYCDPEQAQQQWSAYLQRAI